MFVPIFRRPPSAAFPSPYLPTPPAVPPRRVLHMIHINCRHGTWTRRTRTAPAAGAATPPRTGRSAPFCLLFSRVTVGDWWLVFSSPSPYSCHLTPPRKNREKPTFNISRCSSATVSTAGTYSANPSSASARSMCSHAIVFLASFSEMSFASLLISVTNSTQHSISRSRASFENVWPELGGRISVMIFCTVAVGRARVSGDTLWWGYGDGMDGMPEHRCIYDS